MPRSARSVRAFRRADRGLSDIVVSPWRTSRRANAAYLNGNTSETPMSTRITLWTALAALASSLALSVSALAASESDPIVSVASEAVPLLPVATEAAK